MAYLKLMFDEREIAHLSEDGQYLCANEGVLQYDLPLNLFIGNSRKVPLIDVVVWAKKRIFPRNRMDCKEILEMMGLPNYNAWEIVKRTNACLMEDPSGCASAKMRLLRIQPAAGQEGLWLNIRSQLIPTNIICISSMAKPTGRTYLSFLGIRLFSEQNPLITLLFP